MRIKTQLCMTLLLFGLVLAALSATVITTEHQVKSTSERERLAGTVFQGASELSYLAADYLISQEHRQLDRWQTRFDAFSVAVARLAAADPGQEALVLNIRKNTRRMQQVFDSIVSTVANPSGAQARSADLAYVRLAGSRIAVQSQGLVSDASRLSDLIADQVRQLQQRSLIAVFLLVGISVACFLGTYLFMQRRVLRGLAKLRAGAAEVGSGNLHIRIEEGGSDEIGELTQAFNRMAADLKSVTASKSELEGEVARRNEIERQLREANDNLQNKTRALEKEIEERKRADAERRRLEEEKRKLEARLFQAQKMEAVGQLAGGVAHDFNNLLTPIIGYSDLVLEQLGKSSPLFGEVMEIKAAGERAATLTTQLLAFSRQQVVKPRQLILNDTLLHLEKMLRRIIGEDIEFVTVLAPDLKTMVGDAGQLEQVIMNLVVNARDAMPNGGSLTVKTVNAVIDASYARVNPQAHPGEFVLLSVEDSGCGMDRETMEHIFEPFFTTKRMGEGTGLGLATVYGIVKQHEGWVNVYSEPGRGTNFKLYFPVSRQQAEWEEEKHVHAPAVRGRGQRVLLVEDDPRVRNFVIHLLERNDYLVFAAESAREAYTIFEQEQGEFDLVVSDVVLPDESGPELVGRLLAGNPDLCVLMSSGYADHKAQMSVIQQAGYRFLNKPYGAADLLRGIHEALGGE